MVNKNLLIDLGKLKARYSGLGEMSYNFALNLVSNIRMLEEDNITVYFLLPSSYVGVFGNKIKYVPLNFFRRHFKWFLPHIDCWYAAHQDSGYMPDNRDCKFIMTIHDLNVAYHNNPQKARLRLADIQKKINRSNYLIANSNFTKNEVKQKLNVHDTPFKVVYCGSEDFSKIKGTKPEFLQSHLKFFFHISTITAKKNTKALIEMMKLMPDKNLVIAGSWDSDYAKELIKEIEIDKLDNIIRLVKVNNAEKAWLYQNCDAVFFPSLLEGFGLPVIESMFCGKPVFCSTLTSLPEIGSDKAFYWQHFEPEYMKELVEETMISIEKNRLFPDGLKKYAETFNWTKNILQYIQLFRFLLSK